MAYIEMGDVGNQVRDGVGVEFRNLTAGTITAKEMVIAGGTRGMIRSRNFVSGTSGWRLLGDGAFEAQDGIFRGTLNASDITAGDLNVDRIIAGSIQVGKLVLGSFDNLISNPGFEGDAVEGTLDPHSYQDGSATWVSETGSPRSGGRAGRLSVGGQDATAVLVFNGVGNDINKHPSAGEGDEFLLEVWCRRGATSVAVNPTIRIDFRDEDGVSISVVNTVLSGLTTTYKKFTRAGTCPAGTAYVAFIWRVASGNNSATLFLIDDVSARRKIGTLIIEDQAVDIARMLDPVFQEGANKVTINDTVNTTLSEAISTTVSLASWVGEVNCFMVGTLQMTDSTERLLSLTPEIGGSIGATSQQEISNAGISETITVSAQQHRLITSPGSSVKFALRSKVSTGSNTLNQHEFASIITGIR